MSELTTEGSFPESEVDMIRNLTVAMKLQNMLIRTLWADLAGNGLPLPPWAVRAAVISNQLIEAVTLRLQLENSDLFLEEQDGQSQAN